MRTLAGTFALLAIATSAAHAQRDSTGVARGVVRDSAGRPLDGVEVQAITVGRSARTGADGRFVVAPLPTGATRLVARRPGFRLVDTSFTLAAGAIVDANFVLRRLPTQLDTLRVLSNADCPTRTFEGFTCRRQVGTGVFRDSAELATMRQDFVTDLLYGIEGLRTGVRSGAESTVGWRCLTTLVDGAPPLPGSWFEPRHAIGVEYYAEPNSVPEWYRTQSFAPAEQGARAVANPSGGRRGGGYTPGRPALAGRQCSLLIYWTNHAPRFDPRRDQSKGVKDARRIRALLDSLRG